MQNNWYQKRVLEIFEELNTSERGLSTQEAAVRLGSYGSNELPRAKRDSLFVIFLRQFESPLIYILLGASAIVFLMGEIIDGSIILAVLLFNAIVGSIQEGRAQNTLSALKKFSKTNATVLRDGKEIIIEDIQVVPGDIILLQEGEKMPADARIIMSNNLKVDEATLTGESNPVHKDKKVITNPKLLTSDQKNMVFKGTHVVAGNAKAVVVATGVGTVIGKISKEIASIETEIPLKANIRHLSQLIVIVVLVIGVALFFLGIAYGKPMQEMFITVVALLVSIIPEGLPIVMTLVLATGVWRMSKKNALVKRLQAVESLGQAGIIAVDKTGTITKNEMMVQKVYLPAPRARQAGLPSSKLSQGEETFEITGVGYEPKGSVILHEQIIDPSDYLNLLFLGRISAICSNARVMFSEETQQWSVAGDPTEAAMLVLAEKIGLKKDELEKESPKIAEIPFDYETKYHIVIQKTRYQKMIALAGAPEVVMSLCNKIKLGDKSFLLTQKKKQELESVLIHMSKTGIRVVALAISHSSVRALEPRSINKLTFVGFLGMRDALRPEIIQSVNRASLAGIKVVMITGDHKVTAKAIAKDAGIYHEGDEIMVGQDIDITADKELSEKITKVSVFARVTPEHKIRIIRAYKRNGEVVAMTGDGVNDAPSLVAADLGIAMGKIGTEVAKEASDIVLLDDNFESIVLAVEEGRNIYKTIKKVILYLFSTSFGELFTITGAILLGLALPILPSQIIWLNFVTDGFLDVGLAMEPKEKNILYQKFKKSKKYLIDKLMAYRIVLMALPMMIGTLYLFMTYFQTSPEKAWTMSLTTLAVFQWFNAFNCRSEDKSIFHMNPLSNKFLVGATIIVVILQLFAVYNPFLQNILHTSPLALRDWLLVIPVAFSIVLIEEIRKILYRKRLLKLKA